MIEKYYAAHIKDRLDAAAIGKPKLHYAVQLALYIDILERLGLSAGRRALFHHIAETKAEPPRLDHFDRLVGAVSAAVVRRMIYRVVSHRALRFFKAPGRKAYRQLSGRRCRAGHTT